MAPAAAANALLIRTEQYCINAMTDLLPVFMPDFDFTFNAAQLPAFDMRYYTHDVRGRITDAHGQPLQGLSVRLRDEFTGRRVLGLQLADDGTFVKANVDPEHTFSLTVSADGVDEVTIERQRNARGLTDRALERGIPAGVPARIKVGKAVQRL